MNMDTFKKSLAVLLAAALIVPQAAVTALAADAAAPSAPVTFSGVEVHDDQVTLKLSSTPQYNSFVTQTPPRLVLELLDTKHAAAVRETKGSGKYLAGVRTSQFQREPREVTRVVLDLVKMAVYKISAVTGGLSVQLVGADGDASATAASPATAPAADADSSDDAPDDGPAPAAAPVAPAAVPAATVATPAVKPLAKAKPAPVAVAAAPVEEAPAAAPAPVPAPAPAPAPRAAKAPYDNSAGAALRRAGLHNKVMPELVAAAEAEDLTNVKANIPKDLGEGDNADRMIGGRIYRDIMSRLPKDLISLDYDNTDVRDVIKLLAAKAKVNIIYGPDVSGTLTLHLSNVPFNEAFRTVLSMMQLSTDQVGDNIMRVITPTALTSQRTAATAVTKVIQLNYAKASAVKSVIDQVRQAEGRTGASSVDTPTNSLVVTESLEGMLATENLISQLDQRPRQVLIEAKLVEVNLNNELDYGIQWDAFGQQQGKVGGQQGTTTVGSTAGLLGPAVNNPLDATAPQTSVTAAGGVGASGRGTGVGLPADKIFGAFTLGRVTNNYLLNATITAAASEGKAKVLSDPKIATLNNQAASINVTTQIPYVTSNVSSTGVQTQTVSFVTTGIQLSVTPSINADGRILLMINPNVSQPSVTAAANTQTGAPATDSRTAQTSVLVRDGETIVIGGLISDSLQDTIAKIPILGDIPILGWLFKKSTKKRVRNELLIFVTTHIMPD
jgi:type IV pilus assembly protein PilQ